jgi:hypothetical protein
MRSFDTHLIGDWRRQWRPEADQGAPVRYGYVGDTAVFEFDNPKSVRPSKRNLSIAGLSISRPSLDRLFDAVCRQSQSFAVSSQFQSVESFLKPILAYFRQESQPYPVTSTDWQILLVNLLRFVLIDQGYSALSVRTRIENWQCTMMPRFQYWIEEDIIPCDVQVPGIDFRSEDLAVFKSPLLGHSSTHRVARSAPIQKLLVDVGFAQADADYLSNIERECHGKIAVLRAVCLKHWAAMKADHQTGATLAMQVPATDIDECLREGRYRKGILGGKGPWAPLTSPAFPDGHLWALAIAKRLLTAGVDRECISLKTLRGSPFFAVNAFDHGSYYPALRALSALPAGAAEVMTCAQEFYRFLGVLSGIDVAAACTLLIMENPQFTPFSLQNAQLLNVRGRSYLEATDSKRSARFSVDKPRAGTRKSATLSVLSQEIVTYIIQVTAPLRTLMRRCGHKAWRYLFLGQQMGGRFGPFKVRMTHYLAQAPCSLVGLYPELQAQGLAPGTLDFRRLRNTVGVLRWFETGSIVEMSRSLGNTYQVALEHYLPPALLQAWNTRIIRRFQNTLVVLAAHDEDFLLAVTDFSTLNDLLHFMAQLVHDHSDGSSPIATEIHARFGAVAEGDEKSSAERRRPCDKRLLNLRCSSNSFAYLYAFAEYAVRLDTSQREQLDPSSGLCAQSFIELAEMIRHACENPQISDSIRELLDVKQLRSFHQTALAQQAVLRTQFSRFTLNHAWGA